MGPRVKKARSGKAKDLPTSAEADREIIEAGDDKINSELESQEEVPKNEVDNGGEDAPPLKKSRGRPNVKKGPAKPSAKANVAVSQVDEENVDEVAEKVADDNAVEENNKISSDNDDEEVAPAKKARGRTKKPSKDEVVGKEAANGEEEGKEDLNVAAPGARKGRQRKKKVDDELEVMPKKKDRGARKIEPITGESKIDESAVSNSEDSKLKTNKRDKKQPTKRAGKGKKDQDNEEKLVEEDEMEYKKVEDGQALAEQAEEEHIQDEEGGGDGKPPKKAVRGKAAAKTTDGASNKKPAGRGKKAAKVEDLIGDDDVPVNGKKLRVLVEHCKS